VSLESSLTKTRPQGGSSKRLQHRPPEIRRHQHEPRLDDLTDRFLSREEASLYLNLPVSALAQDVSRQHLRVPCYRFGQLVRYRKSELDAWAEGRRHRGP
jgi:excisionase family DNA binding protein